MHAPLSIDCHQQIDFNDILQATTTPVVYTNNAFSVNFEQGHVQHRQKSSYRMTLFA